MGDLKGIPRSLALKTGSIFRAVEACRRTNDTGPVMWKPDERSPGFETAPGHDPIWKVIQHPGGGVLSRIVTSIVSFISCQVPERIVCARACVCVCVSVLVP